MADKRKFNLKLEKYLLNELSSQEMKKIENNPLENEYIDYLKNDNEEFFKKFDIKELARETEKKASVKAKIIKFPVKTISTIAAAAACFILTINLLPNLGNNKIDEEIILLKGSKDTKNTDKEIDRDAIKIKYTQNINIYLKTDSQIEKLNDLDMVKENDQLQLTYISNDKYGIIVSVDGLNNITYHYPESFNNSTSMEIGKEVSLPTSYTLDNAPYFEKFYIITSKDSFDLNLVNNKVTDIKVSDGTITEDLILPEEYTINSITLLKE